MRTPTAIATRQRNFRNIRRIVSDAVDTTTRFPKWPFVDSRTCAAIIEFDTILSREFCRLLRSIMQDHGDEAVAFLSIEPDWRRYRRNFENFPAFLLPATFTDDQYWEAINYDPKGTFAGAIRDIANVVALAGTSGSWAILAQRDWEIGLLSIDASPVWLKAQPEPGWMSPTVDFSPFRSPEGWGLTLTNDQVRLFRQNVALHTTVS